MNGLKKRPWRVAEDTTGRRILQWAGDADEDDEERFTLDRLDTAGLRLVEDARVERGYDPYDSGVFSTEGSASYSRSRGKISAFARIQHGK
jgi:hypothetical protein